jgi:hypothetical protein
LSEQKSINKGRGLGCQEEMEQDRVDRDLIQAGVPAEAEAGVRVEARDVEEAGEPARAVSVSAQTAVKRLPTEWESLAMNSNARNAERI